MLYYTENMVYMQMKTTLLKFTIALIVIATCGVKLYSQEIEATVEVVTEGLTNDQKIQVDALRYTIDNYVNSQSFTGESWDGPKIPVSIGMQVSVLGTNNYSANLFIASRRTVSEEDGTSVINMKFEDNGKWNFEYSQGLTLSYDFNRYDNIASILDFYMLIIIGLDLDTYGELDGDFYYQRAKRVFDVASNQNATGWSPYATDYGRSTLINELISPRFDDFRKLIFSYYVDGVDLLATDRETALSNIADVIHGIADFKERYFSPSHILDLFFASKCQEICELFKGYTADPKVFRDLMFLDPTNTVRYEAARDGK
jgi:hypothetical protein